MRIYGSYRLSSFKFLLVLPTLFCTGAVLDIAYRSGGGVAKREITLMKEDIHPNYGELVATCSCGNVIKTRSTLAKEIHIDVCSACHPFLPAW